MPASSCLLLLALATATPDCGSDAMGATRARPADGMTVARMTRPPRQRDVRRVAIPAAASPLVLPKVDGPQGRPLIVIDAGHGGMDPGAINPETGLREKDVTLAIARSVRAALLESGQFRVALTRDDDRFLILQERSGIARALKASLFISIHADAAENSAARGGSVYTLSEVASDREAARLAARENRSGLINGVDLSDTSDTVSSILIDLSLRETMARSASFARLLQREAEPMMRFRSDGRRHASLIVLKAPDVPSVLFETAYISNRDDAAFLASADGRNRIATGVRRAVEAYFARTPARPN